MCFRRWQRNCLNPDNVALHSLHTNCLLASQFYACSLKASDTWIGESSILPAHNPESRLEWCPIFPGELCASVCAASLFGELRPRWAVSLSSSVSHASRTVLDPGTERGFVRINSAFKMWPWTVAASLLPAGTNRDTHDLAPDASSPWVTVLESQSTSLPLSLPLISTAIAPVKGVPDVLGSAGPSSCQSDGPGSVNAAMLKWSPEWFMRLPGSPLLAAALAVCYEPVIHCQLNSSPEWLMIIRATGSNREPGIHCTHSQFQWPQSESWQRHDRGKWQQTIRLPVCCQTIRLPVCCQAIRLPVCCQTIRLPVCCQAIRLPVCCQAIRLPVCCQAIRLYTSLLSD